MSREKDRDNLICKLFVFHANIPHSEFCKYLNSTPYACSSCVMYMIICMCAYSANCVSWMIWANYSVGLRYKRPSFTTSWNSSVKLQNIAARLNSLNIFMPGFITAPTFSSNSAFTLIMHQYTGFGHIISMVILNMEVVDFDRRLQNLMLDLFNNDIFAVDQNQNITGTEVNCLCPALDRGIEGMRGRSNDLLAVNKYMDKLTCLALICFYNALL